MKMRLEHLLAGKWRWIKLLPTVGEICGATDRPNVAGLGVTLDPEELWGVVVESTSETVQIIILPLSVGHSEIAKFSDKPSRQEHVERLDVGVDNILLVQVLSSANDSIENMLLFGISQLLLTVRKQIEKIAINA